MEDSLDHFETLPDPQDVSPRPTGIRYGIILALIGFVFTLITHLTGGADPENAASGAGSIIGCLSMIITIAVLVMAVRHHRDRELGGFITFGRGMGVMFWVALVYSLFTAVSNWLYNNVINPEAQDAIKKVIEETRARVEDGEAEEMELTIVETTFQVMNNPLSIMIITFLITMVIGLIVSLIMAKKRPIA